MSSTEQPETTVSISSTTPSATPSTAPSSTPTSNNPPKRFIYTMKDMKQFINSPAKRDLLSFITYLGRSTIDVPPSIYKYNPQKPLINLSPGMASLHGSLHAMATTWLVELPPDTSVQARFGNPVFKLWHDRLVKRSEKIIRCMMDCHVQYVINRSSSTSSNNDDDDDDDDDVDNNDKHGKHDKHGNGIDWDMTILEKCSEAGKEAALDDTTNDDTNNNNTDTNTNNNNIKNNNNNNNKTKDPKQEKVIIELQAYLHQAFGHEIRLDYGTGHECSFYIFLYALCKIGIYGNIPKSITPSSTIMSSIALSITDVYLRVCRGIQTDYMLEPAGSHGVWGLDDYHCIPFYIGSCQLQNQVYVRDHSEYSSPSCIHTVRSNGSTGNGNGSNGNGSNGNSNGNDHDSILYISCIQYIKSLKKGAPFFESSPMLNDISQLPTWSKVSGGLLRLFDGEVLNKKPVVQHFVFGDIFKASWTPDETQRKAPTITFNHDLNPHGINSVAPWAKNR
jgi:hypothetical protein